MTVNGATPPVIKTSKNKTMKPNHCIFFFAGMIISSYAQVKPAATEHYLFPEFTQGVVLLKSGKQDLKLLNYNSLTEQLVFDAYGRVLAVPDEQLARIDTVYIQERRFIIVHNKFVELLHDARWDLYVEHKCALKEKGKDVGYGGTSQTSAVNNPSAVRLGGIVYNMELPDGFETKRYSTYWLMRDGESKPFGTLKQLKKLYKDKIDLLNKYLKTRDVRYEDHEAVIQLIEYMESN